MDFTSFGRGIRSHFSIDHEAIKQPSEARRTARAEAAADGSRFVRHLRYSRETWRTSVLQGVVLPLAQDVRQ